MTTSTGKRTYRRYLVAVSVPELAIRFEPTEALGTTIRIEKKWGVIELAGAEFQWFTKPAFQEATEGEKPILLIEIPVWANRPLAGRTDLSAILDPYRRFWKTTDTKAAERVGDPLEISMTITVFDKDGKETGRLVVTGATPFKDVRALLNWR